MEEAVVQNNQLEAQNPLGTRRIPKLLFSLAIPAIIANIVNSLYNIVDQIFIGHGVGYLGNAATSVAFPLTTICMAIGLMCGLGGSANFNLAIGRQDAKRAQGIVGTATALLVVSGIIICIIVNAFLKDLMVAFGATDQTIDYAVQYTRITSFGIPFLLFSTGFNPIIRADGAPVYSMLSVVIGAVLNTILDPIFIFVCNWGIAGAAWATLIGQIVSAVVCALYFLKFKNVRPQLKDFIPNFRLVKAIAYVGMSSFIFQISTMVIQIVSNNMLKKYGADSVYGSDIPIAIAGIVAKISMIFIAVIIGIVQGAQPIFGYNYGAKKYDRVRATLKLAILSSFAFSLFAFALFMGFPRALISVFGTGSDLYFEFGIKYLRVSLFFTFLNGIQISSTTFFQAVGKATKGAILSLIKQVIFLLPLLVVLPIFMGVEGVMFAAPISDLIAFIAGLAMLVFELKRMPKESLAALDK
ncbi:MAG: MATE family efflux transporter [Clostridia bacterium]|nr:MATE family efflux transporter [Clostridia bacterium]